MEALGGGGGLRAIGHEQYSPLLHTHVYLFLPLGIAILSVVERVEARKRGEDDGG